MRGAAECGGVHAHEVGQVPHLMASSALSPLELLTERPFVCMYWLMSYLTFQSEETSLEKKQMTFLTYATEVYVQKHHIYQQKQGLLTTAEGPAAALVTAKGMGSTLTA